MTRNYEIHTVLSYFSFKVILFPDIFKQLIRDMVSLDSLIYVSNIFVLLQESFSI